MDLYYIRYAIYVYIVVHALGLLFLVSLLAVIAGWMRHIVGRLDELVREIKKGNERA